MKQHTRAFKSLLTVLLLLANFNIYSNNSSKREFRGVWLQTAFQDRYINNSTEESKKYLIKALDRFVEAGSNAVIFQVRPSADAFYCSDIEPVSRFMTGKQGRPGPATWDPMEFLIEECHKRCI